MNDFTKRNWSFRNDERTKRKTEHVHLYFSHITPVSFPFTLYCFLIFLLFSDNFTVFWYFHCFLTFLLFSDIFTAFWYFYCFLIFLLFSDIFIVFWYFYCFLVFLLFSTFLSLIQSPASKLNMQTSRKKKMYCIFICTLQFTKKVSDIYNDKVVFFVEHCYTIINKHFWEIKRN